MREAVPAPPSVDRSHEQPPSRHHPPLEDPLRLGQLKGTQALNPVRAGVGHSFNSSDISHASARTFMNISKKWDYKTSSSGGGSIGMVSVAMGTISLGPPGIEKITLRLQLVSAGAGPSIGFSKLPLPKQTKRSIERAENIPSVTIGLEEAYSTGSVIVMPGCKKEDLEADDFVGICAYRELSGGIPLPGITHGGINISLLYCGLRWYDLKPSPMTFDLMLQSAKACIPMLSRTDVYGPPQLGTSMGFGYIQKEKEEPLYLPANEEESEKRRKFNKPAPSSPPQNLAQYAWQNFQHNTGREDGDD